MGTRRFEYCEGTSNKFWEVWVDRNTVKTRYGKIGAAGQTSARKTPGPLEVRDRLVDEKLRKGYVDLPSPSTEASGSRRKMSPTRNSRRQI